MSVIFSYNLESGDLTGLTTVGTGDLSASASAALAGTNYGIALLLDDTSANYVYNSDYASHNHTGGRFRARIYIDPNSATWASGEAVSFFALRGGGANKCLLQLVRTGTTYYIQAYLYNDAGSSVGLNSYSISDAPHYVEIDLIRAANSTSNDGSLQLWIDGISQETKTGVDNYDRLATVGSFYWGGIVKPASPSGTVFMDELVVNDDGGEIGPLASNQTINITQAATIGEAIAVQQAAALAASAIQAVTTGEEVTINIPVGGTLYINLSDGITAGETLTARQGAALAVSATQAVTAGELVGRLMQSWAFIDDIILSFYDEYLTKSLTDAVTLGEAITIQHATALAVSATQATTIGEAITVSRLEASARNVTATDGATVGEAVTVQITALAVSVTQAATIGEETTVSVAAAGVISIGCSEAVTGGEAVTVQTTALAANVTQAISVGEETAVSVVAAGAINISVTDAATIGEPVAVQTTVLTANATQAVTVGEETAVSVVAVGIININVIEGITTGESVNAQHATRMDIGILEAVLVVSSVVVMRAGYGWTISAGPTDEEWVIGD